MKRQEKKKMIHAGVTAGVITMISSGIGGSIVLNFNIHNGNSILNNVAVGQALGAIMGAIVALVGFRIYANKQLGNENILITTEGE